MGGPQCAQLCVPPQANRDRFVLSNGHSCALLYSMLHLTGYDLTLDDLKAFRQLGSRYCSAACASASPHTLPDRSVCAWQHAGPPREPLDRGRGGVYWPPWPRCAALCVSSGTRVCDAKCCATQVSPTPLVLPSPSPISLPSTTRTASPSATTSPTSSAVTGACRRASAAKPARWRATSGWASLWCCMTTT